MSGDGLSDNDQVRMMVQMAEMKTILQNVVSAISRLEQTTSTGHAQAHSEISLLRENQQKIEKELAETRGANARTAWLFSFAFVVIVTISGVVANRIWDALPRGDFVAFTQKYETNRSAALERLAKLENSDHAQDVRLTQLRTTEIVQNAKARP